MIIRLNIVLMIFLRLLPLPNGVYCFFPPSFLSFYDPPFLGRKKRMFPLSVDGPLFGFQVLPVLTMALSKLNVLD